MVSSRVAFVLNISSICFRLILLHSKKTFRNHRLRVYASYLIQTDACNQCQCWPEHPHHIIAAHYNIPSCPRPRPATCCSICTSLGSSSPRYQRLNKKVMSRGRVQNARARSQSRRDASTLLVLALSRCSRPPLLMWAVCSQAGLPSVFARMARLAPDGLGVSGRYKCRMVGRWWRSFTQVYKPTKH